MMPPCVLAIDSGGMTGLACCWEQGRAFYADEYEFLEAGDHVEHLCQQWGPALLMILEKYRIDRRRPQTHAHLALEMSGVARRAALKNGCQLLEPGPRERLTATPEVLKALGWWVPGKDDAQAAAQHLAAHLIRSGNLPPAGVAVLSEPTGTL